MSIPWLTLFALLVWIAVYRIFYTLVKSVRLVGACIFTTAFIVIAQNLEEIGHQWSSFGTSHSHSFSDQRAPTFPAPSEQPDIVADRIFQNISREDQSFLDEYLREQNPDDQQVLKPVAHKAIVRRAQLVTQNETSKRAELVRSRQR